MIASLDVIELPVSDPDGNAWVLRERGHPNA